jgi:predicted SprT family Zn-dependent metalloprotease
MAAPAQFSALIHNWGEQWGVPDLHEVVTVEFSTRMTSALGRCQPTTGQIRLAARLMDAEPALLNETLCHEVAHVAVRRLHGPEAKPHGDAWAALVSQAGFAPRTKGPANLRSTEPAVSASPDSTPPPPGFRFEHRCPVCQAVRFGRRAVPAWHCTACLEVGLPGEMMILRTRDEGEDQ